MYNIVYYNLLHVRNLSYIDCYTYDIYGKHLVSTFGTPIAEAPIADLLRDYAPKLKKYKDIAILCV
jgi:hypothetical protein